MPSFVSVEVLTSRYNLGSGLDVQKRLLAAGNAASIHLASFLRTQFDIDFKSDIFEIDSHQQPFPGRHPELFLSQGFVDTDTLPLIKLSTTYGGLSAGTDFPFASTNLNKRMGTLVLINEGSSFCVPLDKTYCEVSYSAGFVVETSPDPMPDPAPAIIQYLYQGAPNWLEEAASILSYGIFMGENGECEVATAKTTPYAFEAATMLNRYIRYAPASLRPMNYAATT